MRYFRLLAWIPALLVLGCASDGRIEQGPRIDAGSNFSRSVSIGPISGADGTNPRWDSAIRGADFKTLLEQELEQAGVLKVPPAGATYRLSVRLDALEQPGIGLSEQISSSIRYRLEQIAGEHVIVEERFVIPHALSLRGSVLRDKGPEGVDADAVRDNIRAFIRYLATGRR